MNLPSYPDYDEERLTLSDSEGLIPKVTDRSKRFDCRQTFYFPSLDLKVFIRIDWQDLFAITDDFYSKRFSGGFGRSEKVLPARLPKRPKRGKLRMQLPKEQNALNVNGQKIGPKSF